MSKINKLESLCRAMQAERQARKMLETEGVGKSESKGEWYTFRGSKFITLLLPSFS